MDFLSNVGFTKLKKLILLRYFLKLWCAFIVMAISLFGVSLPAFAEGETDLQVSPNVPKELETGFSQYYDLVYQIRVISPQAGSKSSIGSGFQVSATGLLITNYHVVSDFVQSPETHQIKYRSHNGEIGKLDLLDFDVVNDLALLRLSKPEPRYFKFASQRMRKGETVYALGNPRDYGISLVPGPNNGMVEHSYNEQVLFSGSLNPGMSGGPALNKRGEVVGVNVATAGAALSFLVPADKAVNLVSAARSIPQESYQAELANQIKQWQRPRLQQLIDNDWATETFSDEDLFGEIRKDFQCWGNTNDNDKERFIERASKNCRAGNSVYLSRSLNTGQLLFSFSKKQSLKLNPLQFSSTISTQLRADNSANYRSATNYQCHVDFLKSDKEVKQESAYHRLTTCVRAYKKLPNLYDSLLYFERISNDQSFSSHLSIAGAERDQIQLLNRKFVERSL